MSASKSESVDPGDPTALLGAVVDDLAGVLGQSGAELIPAFTGERSVLDIEFLYRPPEGRARQTAGSGSTAAAGVASPGTGSAPAGAGPAPTTRRELTVNAKCTLCSERMYPVRRYRRTGRKPVLMLYYNGAFGSRQKPDRSDKLHFSSAAEDDLFARMLGAAGLAMEDLYYQEYPACHFNDSRSLPEEWNERAGHCLGHVGDTIKEFDIRVLLLTGPAAIFLLSEEKARQHAASAEPLHLPLADRELPALVLRSPAALLALESKREKLKAAGPEKEAEYKKTVQEEKQIKSSILQSLKRTLSALG